MDDVRVHYNSDKPQQIGALAYTEGKDIHIADGQEKHLPHEGWHAVQQKQDRVRPTLQMKTGVHVNDDETLEKEADLMGMKAADSCKIDFKEQLPNHPMLQPKPNSGNVIQRTVSKGNTYIVKSGDILSEIAGKYNTTVDELVKLNKIKDKNKIYPGQVLILPKKIDKSKTKENANKNNDLPKDLDRLKTKTSYDGVSIKDYLKKIGVDNSRENCAKIAKYLGIVSSINSYEGTAQQNTAMLAALRKYAKSQGKVTEKSEKPAANSKTDSKTEKGGNANLVSTAEKIIFGNEGNYATVAKDDNGALSIGKIQWHGSRAKDLLNKIKGKNINLTKNTLTESLYIELDYSDKYWDTKTLNNEEVAAISKLLVTAEGKAAQDEQSRIDVGDYLNVGKGLGITDNRTLVYFADLYNQSPANAIKIVKAAGGGNGLSLDKIHKAALANGVMGKYKDRRNTTYNACKKIGSGTDKTKSSSDKANTKPSSDKDNTKGKDKSKEDKIDEETPYADMTKKEKEAVIFGEDRKYYTTRTEASKNMVGITIKVWKYNSKGELYSSQVSLTVNKNLQDDVKAIFNEIYESDEKFPIKSVGAYNFRKMAASSSLSHHSYGTAIDINPDENYMIKKDKTIVAGKLYEPGKNKYSLPADGSVVKAFKRHGWIWGGEWTSSKDYMHFSFLGN